ncbi:MAG: DUF4880 domain-containing protein, partial [Sphingomonadaceae bacterium]
MPDQSSPNAEDRRAEEAAAWWYARTSGEPAAHDDARFAEWMADPQNAAAYRAVESAVGLFDDAADPQ